MKGDTPLIEYDTAPKRLRFIDLPVEGLVVRYRDNHEEYLRSCPGCGHRMGVSTRWGGMMQWYCPVAEEGGSCQNTQRDAVAKMTSALATDIAEISSPEKCHLCGETNLMVQIRRLGSRIEIIVQHPAGSACEAETIYVFQTYRSDEYGKQEWNSAKDKPKPVAELLKTLEAWSPEEADKKIKEGRNE